MALTKKKAGRVAHAMVSQLGRKAALELMERMNEAAVGKKPAKPLRSFKRIMNAISDMK
jgi:hypothetical protein